MSATQHHASAAPSVRLSRVLLATLLGGALAAALVSGCSSKDEKAKGACDGKQCGIACTTTADCGPGTHCDTTNTCSAQCYANGDDCGNGLTCDGTGACVMGGMFGGGGLTGTTGDASCADDIRRGEGLAADIYIMNDQSQSMSCAIPTGGDRWTAMKTALSNFVQSPQAAGLNVGIQYFGILKGRRDTQGSCTPADYVNPDVELGLLPGNAQAIIDSLNNHGPSTYTPTPAALDGALQHAVAWQQAHTARTTTVVLATDGQPNLCLTDPGDPVGSVVTVAAKYLSGPTPIRTYVIGIVGGSAATGGQGCNLDPQPPNKPDLDRVAQAGGTQEALIVDAANGDTTTQFLDALNKIRDAATVPCQYVMPTGNNVNPNQVNVEFVNASGAKSDLLNADTEAACGTNAGWYYDDNQNPTKILLCPATCDQVKADARAGINVHIGCKATQHIPK
ncbi:MAG TPA: vWA domain-containing protein [Polyangiaceae bacterium]|nr:vWA domain-containing protein [Polyangiaceae bacterium]